MTTAIDPTRVEHAGLLLSEFVGNQSVYYNGMPNPVQSDVWTRGSPVILHWESLAQMLTEIRAMINAETEEKAFSISYGWIHPRLSERIVSWKPGHEPSYHRWDMGAACDINFHAITYVPYHYGVAELESHGARCSPLAIARTVNTTTATSLRPRALDRTLTYSESPYLCFGTAVAGSPGLGKWYENRFEGTRNVKPRFITYRGGRGGPGTASVRSLEVDWRGGGWPSHHGGGKRQYHHIRTSLYTVMSDWLYDRDRVHFGQANRMPMSTRRYDRLKHAMHRAGAVFDVIQSVCTRHVAIVQGVKIDKRTSNWEENDNWSFTVAAPLVEGEEFYRQLVDEVLPSYRESLGIETVLLKHPRSYLTPEGRPAGIMQTLVEITGGSNCERHYDFDFDTPARSPEFREAPEGGSDGGDPGPEGVPDPPRRTRRRRSEGGSRRSIRTRTFRRPD